MNQSNRQYKNLENLTSRTVSFVKSQVKHAIFLIKNCDERNAIRTIIVCTFLFCFWAILFSSNHSGSSAGHGGHGGHDAHNDHEESEAAIEIESDILESNDMTIESIGPQILKPTIPIRGQVIANPNKELTIRPRFSGIVKQVSKDYGDIVHKGDILITIENTSTRSTFSIRSVIDGILADKKVIAGTFVPENESILTVVDLKTVWFQGKVPISDKRLLAIGQKAIIKDRTLGVEGMGTIVFLSQVADEDSQACELRIEINNDSGKWRIGSFAEATVSLSEYPATIAVKTSALQNINDSHILFIRTEDGLAAKSVKIGRSDGDWTEVLAGVSNDQQYLSQNSFLAKAELLKSTAAHEH
ncbi:MAG: efflux RND transporter periplasmic adaptor subunit [Proteobacteria bacterium]|nr:efflux RND transporter periplasmic adaptor subunit [Pseudomonadota bacterium]